MNAKKKRTKNRRRARKLADQAWEAAEDGCLDLAIRIIRRAADLDPANPVLWNDRGVLLQQAGDDVQAAESFQAAISLVPDFAEAYDHLARIRVRQGLLQEAAALQQQAVTSAPESASYRRSLAAYLAMAGRTTDGQRQQDQGRHLSASPTICPIEQSLRNEFPDLARAVDRLDWPALSTLLTERGVAMIDGLLTPTMCEALRHLFHQDVLFAKTVVMDKSRFGAGVYRYFDSPLPAAIDAIRRIVYPQVAQIANNWQRMLGLSESFPVAWEGFRLRCAQFGQTVPTPLLLRYEAGGFNDLHQDIRGDVYFPIQLVILLSRRQTQPGGEADGFRGGRFLFCDDPLRRKSDRHVVEAGLGDAILFCTRARLVPVAGVYGWQPVKHGIERVESGTRFALGVPFHEYQ